MKARVINTIRGQVYELLKKQICSGEYSPGQWLLEKDLADQFSVSRSPVREALRQLASEGFLVDVPNKGMFVRMLTKKDLEEIFDLRILLENHALYLASQNIQPADALLLQNCLAQLDAASETGDTKRYAEIDRTFHSLFFQFSGNTLLSETNERLCDRFHPFRLYSLTTSEQQKRSNSEHRQIVQYLIQGKVSQAQAADREHLELAKQQMIIRLDD